MNVLLRQAAQTGLVAGVLSGIPSTLFSLVRGWDPFEATEAAGFVLLGDEERRPTLLAAAIPVHLTISIGWALVLTVALPHRRTVVWGAVAGLGIAALDLGPLARPFPHIRALRLAPQVADHVAFGAIAGACVQRFRVAS